MEKVTTEPCQTCQAEGGEAEKLLSVLAESWVTPVKPQPARDAMVWAKHEPYISLRGQVSARDVFFSRARKPKAKEGINQKTCI